MSLNVIINIFSKYWPMFLRGAGTTLYISMVGTIVGSVIGLLVGLIRTIPAPERGFKKILIKIVNGILSFYVEFFRGTPMIVQAMVIYYGSAQAFGIDLNRTVAAIFIVSINTGAYMSEIVRGGIVSIDNGQYEAADTSVLNVISVTELYFQTSSIVGINYRYYETFFITCIIYLIMTFTITRILRFIERKLDGPENYIMIANQMQVERPEDMIRRTKNN